MVTVPVALIMAILFLVFGDERAANIAAHKICPNTHVIRAGENFEFGCDGRNYRVLCADRVCEVEPPQELPTVPGPLL